jgi:hypothetical protein
MKYKPVRTSDYTSSPSPSSLVPVMARTKFCTMKWNRTQSEEGNDFPKLYDGYCHVDISL